MKRRQCGWNVQSQMDSQKNLPGLSYEQYTSKSVLLQDGILKNVPLKIDPEKFTML